MNTDIVFSGGGVLGFAFVGAVSSLEKHNYKFKKIAGTSVGSVISSLLAAGYRADEIKSIMDKTDFKKLREPTALSRFFYPGQLLSLIFNKGIYQNTAIRQWIYELLAKKGVKTFKHLNKNGEYTLKVVAADITQQKMIIIPDDLPKYGLNPETFPVADAVIMSCSIPFYFTPSNLNYPAGSSEVVDGGLLSTFPIWIFDVQGVPRWPTFGFRFSTNATQLKDHNNGLIEFCKDVIFTSINYNQDIFVRDKDKVRTVQFDPLGISTVNFELNSKEKTDLFNEGYKKTERFLNGWSFEKYVTVYRR